MGEQRSMEQERHPADSARASDTNDYEEYEEWEEEDTDALTFDLDNMYDEYCGNCKRKTLKEEKRDGFLILYCTHCKKYVCPLCLFPELKPYKSNGESGWYCSKIPNSTNANCGKRLIRTLT